MAKPAQDQSANQPDDAGGAAKDAKKFTKWEVRLERAKRKRRDWELQYRVELCEQYFLGNQSNDQQDIILNHFLATAKSLVPALFFTNPKFLVRPLGGRKAPASDRHAAAAEGLLYSIAQQNSHFEKAIKLGVTQALFRLGVLKVIYDPTFENNPQKGDPIFDTDAAGQPLIDQLTQQPRQMKDPGTGELMVEPATVLSDEVYRWEWVNAKRMLLPDEGPDMTRWTWIAEEIEVSLEIAKEDERFPQRLRDQFVACGKDEDSGTQFQANTFTSDDDDNGIFRYVEIWDIRKKRWMCLAAGQPFEEFLIDDDFPDGIEDHPYAILPGWTPIIGPEPSPWPLPITQSWLDPQYEYNVRRRQTMEGAKRSARKVFYEDGTFDDADDAIKALRSPRDMEAVKVNSLSKVPVTLQDPDINPAIARDTAMLQSDWRLITGQTAARLGGPSKGSATEAVQAEQAASMRELDMRNDVVTWLTAAGKKMFQLLRATLTIDKWARIRGFDDKELQEYAASIYGVTPDRFRLMPGLRDALAERLGSQQWLSVTRDMLTFEANVEIIPGSTRARNLDIERSQWLEFLAIIGKFPQLAMSRELLAETAAKYDFISERMMDELAALAEKMMSAQQQVAGRGGEKGGQPTTAASLMERAGV